MSSSLLLADFDAWTGAGAHENGVGAKKALFEPDMVRVAVLGPYKGTSIE